MSASPSTTAKYLRAPGKSDEHYRQYIKSKVVISPTGCWLWNGWVHPRTGYGHMSYHSKGWRVHRLAFYLWRGPIPMKCDVCHTCDVRHCCNPDHLWPGLNVENLHDASRKGRHHCQVKTHCPQGHPYTPENTQIRRTKSFTGVGRACITCMNIGHKKPSYIAWRREYQRKRRALKRQQRLGSTLQRQGDA
jgi:hypothetical protein